nr:unnamed protein product [Callosobruchus analis]
MATVAERKFKTLTAKKEALFKVIQKLYDLSKNLDSDTKINQFRKLYFSLEDTRKNLMEVLDELNMTMLEIDTAYSPDYNLIGTVNDMCYYIQRASKHLEKQDTDAQQQRSESTRVLPRLPNMELPEFSGGIKDWEAFYSVFKSRVHDNKSISNDDKIDYLIGRLKGPALSVCSTVAATGENYEIVWNALVEKYQDKRQLANSYLKQILDFKTLQGESERGLNLFWNHLMSLLTH